jgi:hypothetical protein
VHARGHAADLFGPIIVLAPLLGAKAGGVLNNRHFTIHKGDPDDECRSVET